MADEKITVIDDKDREEEALSLCKWAAARAGVIVVVPGLGTLSTVANDIYMIMKIGSVYEEKITEKAAVSLLGSMGTVFAGGKLATLIPFAPLQIPGHRHDLRSGPRGDGMDQGRQAERHERLQKSVRRRVQICERKYRPVQEKSR